MKDLREDEVGFEKECLAMDKYDFKLLVLVTVLAEKNLAYRGTIGDMCKYLGVSEHSKNKKAIKLAIEYLRDNGFLCKVEYEKNNKIWVLALAEKIDNEEVIRIKKKWVEMVKALDDEQRIGVGWFTILRIWLYLIANEEEVITNKKIGEDLAIGERTVRRVKKVLVEELKAIRCIDKWQKNAVGYSKTGQEIDVFAWID